MMKVRAAEGGWNNRDPAKVCLAYTVDTKWRNRSEIFQGREKVQEFLSRKWSGEREYRLIKEYWAHGDDRIAVRFAYEYNTADGKWFRAYGKFSVENLEASFERRRKWHRRRSPSRWPCWTTPRPPPAQPRRLLRGPRRRSTTLISHAGNENWEFDQNGLMKTPRAPGPAPGRPPAALGPGPLSVPCTYCTDCLYRPRFQFI